MKECRSRRSAILSVLGCLIATTRTTGTSAFVMPSPRAGMLHNSVNRGTGYFVITEDDMENDEDCSIFNLDACFEEVADEWAGMTSERRDLQDNSAFTDDDGGTDSYSQYLKAVVKQPVVEVILVGLVLLSCFVVAVGTLQSLPDTVLMVCQLGEVFVSAIFTVEYILRWYLKGFSPSYVIEPLPIIDLIAILPGAIKFISILGIVDVPSSLMGGALIINLRLLRVLRLQRVLKDYDTFCKFEQALGLDPSDARPYQLQLARVVISIFTLLSITAGVVYSAEHEVNPDIPDYFTALYFALTTISTVGYGDIAPVTTAGRWAVSASILIGVAIVPAQAAALAEALLNRSAIEAETEEDDAEEQGVKREVNQLDDRIAALEGKLEDTSAKLDKILEKLG